MHVDRIGVDVGFGDTKLVRIEDGLHTLSFPSVIGHAERRAKINAGLGGRRRKSMVIEYQDQEYFVGQASLEESRMVSSRQDVGRIGSDEERLLMLTALAQAGIDHAMVVTGLPVLWWDHRRKLVRSWEGEHQIKVNGKPRTTKVLEVRPVWQPLGSFYCRFLGDDGRATVDEETMRAGFGILDIGMNTTDLSGIENLVPNARWSGGVRVGVRDALSIIRDDLEDQYHVTRPIAEIAYALRWSQTIKVYREAYTLDGNAAPALDTLARQIVSEATNLWGQADRFHTVLITGGGAALVGKAVKQAFPHNAEVLSHPAMANATGFARFAQRKVFRADRG